MNDEKAVLYLQERFVPRRRTWRPMRGRTSRTRPARGSDVPAARSMAEMLDRVDQAPDQGVLLGLEGQSAALYFGEFGRMLKTRPPGESFDFTTRGNERPKTDPPWGNLSA